jgi:hypothetical protein
MHGSARRCRLAANDRQINTLHSPTGRTHCTLGCENHEATATEILVAIRLRCARIQQETK